MAREHFLRGFTDIREHVCVGTRSSILYLGERTRCGGYLDWDGAFRDRPECPIPGKSNRVLNRPEIQKLLLIRTDVCHQTLPNVFLVVGTAVLGEFRAECAEIQSKPVF